MQSIYHTCYDVLRMTLVVLLRCVMQTDWSRGWRSWRKPQSFIKVCFITFVFMMWRDQLIHKDWLKQFNVFWRATLMTHSWVIYSQNARQMPSWTMCWGVKPFFLTALYRFLFIFRLDGAHQAAPQSLLWAFSDPPRWASERTISSINQNCPNCTV